MVPVGLLFLITAAYGGMPVVWLNDTNFTPRIIKGQPAKIGEFPYMASVRWKPFDTHACGGSILTKNWILTAAHCCAAKSKEYSSVQVGSIDRKKGGSVSLIDRMVIHEEFRPSSSRWHDVCLLRVINPFVFGRDIQQVTLPTSNWTVNSGDGLTVSGWGYTDPDDVLQPNPEILQKADTFVALSNEECRSETGADMYPGYLCARGGVKGQGACNGDSGSPIVKKGVQVGIASWIYYPCGSGKPDFFARVSYYSSWIQKQLGPEANELKFAKHPIS